MMKEKLLCQLLSSFDQKIYLSGLRIPSLNLFPKRETESGFLVFLVKKKSKKTILKVLWKKEFDFRFKNEIFVYNDLPKIKPSLKELIPWLINHSLLNLKYLEIEYLEGFKKLGETQVVRKISKKIFTKLLEAISSFHLSKDKLSEKDFLQPYRGYLFYGEKLFHLDTGKRISFYFGDLFFEKIKNLLEKNKQKLSEANFLVLGDRNPSNILIKNEKIKIIDFDRIGLGNPAFDFSFLFLVLIEFSDLQKELLEYLKKKYQKIKNFWFVFWFDVLFRTPDVLFFWEKKDKKRFLLLKNNFLSIFDKL